MKAEPTDDKINSDPTDKAESWLNAICDSIKESAKLHIPLCGEYSPTQRCVSDRTKAMIAKRIRLVSRNASRSALRKVRNR